MPRDHRAYITFPDNFWLHPRIEALSNAAFRAFVEMNGYSHMNGLDGVISLPVARKRWGADVIQEIVDSDERPVVRIQSNRAVIRDYADHQTTRADIEAMRAAKSSAGRRGGRASATARAQAGAQAEPKQPNQTKPNQTKPSIDVPAVRACLKVATGKDTTYAIAEALASDILARATGDVDRPMAYIRSVITRDPAAALLAVQRMTPRPDIRQPEYCKVHAYYPMPCARCADD